MNQEQHDMLIQVNTNMITLLKAVDALPCEKRGHWITSIAVKQGKIEERVDTHYKIIWGAIGTSLTTCVGLIGLLIKGMLSFSTK